MTDEQYVFIQDIKEKKSTARGAFHKKGGSKSKKCTLPSDYLTRKEKEAMNGEVKSWNMNEFYTWEEFKQMPVDIAAAYISTLNQKYRISPSFIARKLFHVADSTFSTHLRLHGIKEKLNVVSRGPGSQSRSNMKAFLAAIENAKNPRVDISKNVFIPDGMAPGYCSDGTKVKDAIKEAVDAANKKLVEDASVPVDEVIADIHKDIGVPKTASMMASIPHGAYPVDDDEPSPFLDFSRNPDGEEFNRDPSALKKEKTKITAMKFELDRFDADILSKIAEMFEGESVTVMVNVIRV